LWASGTLTDVTREDSSRLRDVREHVFFVHPSVSSSGTGNNEETATATFTTGQNSVTITLQNLIVNQRDVGQNVSDLFFKLSTEQSSGSISSSSAIARTVAGNGSFSDGGSVATAWSLGFVSGTGISTGFHLDDLNGMPITPAHTLLGQPGPGNVYGNANNSITGNVPHNPFLAGTATFVLTIAGVTADSTISQATFSFGTTSGDDHAGTIVPPVNPVPEPTSLVLALTAMVPLGIVGLRARRSASR
jgi:hypothetical protein